MRERDQLRRHAALLDRMAEAVGLDLQEVMIQGQFPMGELADAVIKCSNCAKFSDCDTWLDDASGPGRLPPQYCLNREALEELGAACSRSQAAEFGEVSV